MKKKNLLYCRSYGVVFFTYIADWANELVDSYDSSEMKNDVKRYAKQNGLEDCLRITGWVDEPMDYVELFDVACLLSCWERFGLVSPEYMMVGEPIVASNVDAIPPISFEMRKMGF